MSYYANQVVITEQDWWNSIKKQMGNTTYVESNLLNEELPSFLDPSKSPILQGAKDFAGGFSTGYKQGVNTSTKHLDVLKSGLLKTATLIGTVAEKFSNTFKVDPVTAAMIIGVATYGGPAAVPAYILAIALRRQVSKLANKTYDTIWYKLTGKSVEELDQMWKDWNDKNPITITPPDLGLKVGMPKLASENFNSFNSFLKNKDKNLFRKIYIENEYQEGAKEIGEFLGKGVGYGVGFASNVISSAGRMLTGVLKMIAGNPISTGKVLFGILIGSVIAHYGTKALSKVKDMIEGKLSATEAQQFKQVAQDSGVPQKEIQQVAQETGNPDFENYLEKPGSVNVADADTDTDNVLSKISQKLDQTNKSYSNDIADYIKNPENIVKNFPNSDRTIHTKILDAALQKNENPREVLSKLLQKFQNEDKELLDLKKTILQNIESSSADKNVINQIMKDYNSYMYKYNLTTLGINSDIMLKSYSPYPDKDYINMLTKKLQLYTFTPDQIKSLK